MTSKVQIVNATEAHLQGILDIFNYAVKETFAVWTEREDTMNDRRAWMHNLHANNYACIVALDIQNKVLGYGAYGPFRNKSGYDISVEHSVYVSPTAQGQGIGNVIMKELIQRAINDPRLERMIAAIDAGNPASIKLHDKFGFETQGLLKGVAKKWNEDRDLQLMIKDIKSPSN